MANIIPGAISKMNDAEVTNDVANSAALFTKMSANINGLIDRLTPIGSILPWVGGYFQNNENGSYQRVLGTGNSANAVNNYLPSMWRVCNGAELNDPESPIFNEPGRFLPRLNDSRFLQGSTSVGGSGGDNSISHEHTIASHTHNAGGLRAMLGTTAFTGPMVLRESGTDLATLPGVESSYPMRFIRPQISSDIGVIRRSETGPTSDSFTGTTLGDNPNLTRVEGTTSGSGTLNTSSASTENRPRYLSVFFIMRVK
jgi:hypothetical protein